jgi:hypothetical protein
LNSQKKVLIISYYWPPAGGPGVQRWLKFVKYLPDFDYQPIVYIPENPNYPLLDEKFLKEVSQKAIIIKQPIFEPYGLASFFGKNKTKKLGAGIITDKKKQSFAEKMMLWIRGNFFIPDARIFWVKPSVKYLKKYITENQIETIITTGPPHSLHLIGLLLKKKLNVNWIADFRDPWTTIGYHKELKLSPRAANKHKLLEKEVLNTCDTVLVTSPTTKKEFELLTKKPVEVITNGYDSEHVEKVSLDKKFTLAHIGSLLSERNPKALWQSLQELCNENSDFAQDFKLKLIGAVSKEVLETISQYHLTTFTDHLGYLSHNEALKHQRSSQVLLLIEIDSLDTQCIIPGKLFEYMVSERPILAIGPKDSDFEAIIKNTNTGSFFLYSEKDEIKARILELYTLYKKNILTVNAVDIEQYSRKALTNQLVNLLNKF